MRTFVNPATLPDEVQAALSRRQQAREQKNWQQSDELREKILQLGYKIEDAGSNQHVFKSTN